MRDSLRFPHCIPNTNHAKRTNAVDEWTWSPLAMSGASCGPGDEEAEAFSMPHTIPGVGFEWPLWLNLWYK
jgi:hypothetical protein